MNINPGKNLESRFVRTLNGLVNSLMEAMSTAKTAQQALRFLERYVQSAEYKDWCELLALRVTTQVNQGVFKTWREAAQKAGRGSEIYKKIQQDLSSPLGGDFWLKVQENASLIQKFPSDTFTTLTKYIAEEGLKGRRSSDIFVNLIKKFPTEAKSRLRLIARTEVSKTQTALTKSRAESLGLNWYIWRTSEDERVRGSHDKMNGVIVNWKDPPDPEKLIGAKSYGKYHAGDIFNCRCYPEPIVNLDYVKFPAKVYINGSIRSMSRKQFEKIAA